MPTLDLRDVAAATSLTNNTDELRVNLVGQVAGTTVYGPFYNPHVALRLASNISQITAGSLTVTLLGYDMSSGATWTIIASTAVAAPGLTRMGVNPGFAAAANVNAQDQAPTFYQIQCVVATGPVWATIGEHGSGT